MCAELRAYLIYAPGEGERNRAFIQMFQEEGRRQGISFSYVSLEEYGRRGVPDLVLNRTRLPEVSRWYEERGCVALHNSAVVEIANDKWKTLRYLLDQTQRGGLPALRGEKWIPDTLYFPSAKRGGRFLDMDRPEGYSCIAYRDGRECIDATSLGAFLEGHLSLVIKTVSGHGGTQVASLGEGRHFSGRDGEKTRILRKIEGFLERYSGEDVIVQERIACQNRDVRMYILGNQMYQGVLRQGRGDFRSNFSLGGEVRAFCPSDKQQKWMEQVLLGFENHTLGMAGMDFLLGEDGNLYFNELEEMVGSRMLYQATDRDIVKDYVHWMKLCMHAADRVQNLRYPDRIQNLRYPDRIFS